MEELSFGQFRNLIPEGQIGEAKVEHFEVDKFHSAMTNFHAGAGLTHVPEGKYVKLLVNGHVVMSDTRMEWVTNIDVMNNANGNVLIAGFGLAFIIYHICQKNEVKSVLVIEKSQDVIALILPHVKNEKLEVLCADIWEWKPEKGRKFDTIYFDIWSTICEDSLPEMGKLHQRFKNFKNRENPNCYMNSWSREWLLSGKRSSRGGGLF